MDYKKSKAPSNTVTRNIMDLCDETGNIYKSVAIISKRANQISVEIKQDLSKNLQNSLHTMIVWKKYSKTESKSKYQDITRNSRSLLYWLLKNSLTAISIGVMDRRTIKRICNDTKKADAIFVSSSNIKRCMPVLAVRSFC